MLPGGPVKTAMVEALRLLREQDLGDADDLADRIHSRLQLPVLTSIPQAGPAPEWRKVVLHDMLCQCIQARSMCCVPSVRFSCVMQDPGKGNEFVPGKRKGPRHTAKSAVQQVTAESSAHSLAQSGALTENAL